MKQRLLAQRSVRYLIVGAVCAGMYNAAMILGDVEGVHYTPMTFISFLIVTPLGYVLHCSFTFSERCSLNGLFRFGLGVAAGFPLSLLTLAVLCTGLGMRVAIAAPLTTAILFLWNYVLAHWAIIGKPWLLSSSWKDK